MPISLAAAQVRGQRTDEEWREPYLMTALVDRIRQFVGRFAPEPFDPSQFQDPVATTTDWTPLQRSGANFCTRVLRRRGARRMDFRSSWSARLFSAVFLATGLAIPYFFGGRLRFFPHVQLRPEEYAVLGFSAVFLGVGLISLAAFVRPIVFDQANGFFWKGFLRRPHGLMRESELPQSARLEEVHALQILSRLRRGEDRSYLCYELNLVLHDGSRRHVVAHGRGKRLRADAAALSEFLAVPVWDAG